MSFVIGASHPDLLPRRARWVDITVGIHRDYFRSVCRNIANSGKQKLQWKLNERSSLAARAANVDLKLESDTMTVHT